MKEHSVDITRHIAGRIKEARAARRVSLDALARKSGVSRSMISLIERGEASPTAVVLEKLAAALNLTLASLFEVGGSERKGPVSRRGEQAVWEDPASGYRRRNVSPGWAGQPLQIVEVEFPAGERVAMEAAPREGVVYQQVWVLEGRMEISVGNVKHRLEAGDCLAMELGEPIVFSNPGARRARYVVVLATGSSGRRGT